MNETERIEAACSFLLQSPPGEINDVLNGKKYDVRNIISDDEPLEESAKPVLREYNLAQFTTVDVPGTDHQSIISEAARISATEDGQERFLDPRSRTSFIFDHLRLEASDPQPLEVAEESEAIRSALEKATLVYLAAHFHDGVSSVFSSPSNTFVIQIVANKYNPTNYWSGRWRSEYIVDTKEDTVVGKVLVSVHYYEQGNVQLSTSHSITINLPSPAVTSPPGTGASRILALIETEEGKYQTSLNETYHEMGEKTFKGLRRALPMTRQKIEWEKVLGYKLGAEINSSKGGFGS